MAKFAFAYQGGGMPETPEEGERVMAAWGAWYQQLGSAVVDGGAPFGASASVSPGGGSGGSTTEAPSALTGYTLVTAADIGAATEMAKGCPILDAGGRVDIYECIDMQV